ncbi:hypothetical protein Trydic_g5990 [Trypoxylus dichotomus]
MIKASCSCCRFRGMPTPFLHTYADDDTAEWTREKSMPIDACIPSYIFGSKALHVTAAGDCPHHHVGCVSWLLHR